MSLSFTRPEYLLLLPVAGALLWLSARVSYADLRGARRGIAWAARLLLVLALILALAGTQLVRQSKGTAVVFAVDASHSVPPTETDRALEFVRRALKYRKAEDHAALVIFGREARVESEGEKEVDRVTKELEGKNALLEHKLDSMEGGDILLFTLVRDQYLDSGDVSGRLAEDLGVYGDRL